MIITKGQKIEVIIPANQELKTIELEAGADVRIVVDGARNLQLDVMLLGEGAKLEIYGVFAGHTNEEQNMALHVIQDAPRTSCNIRFRTALDGASISRFDGLIRMTERAVDSHARLSYRSILLSKQSRCIPIPRLEILTKRVASASHEASVGAIDPQQLFYLQSRGLSLEKAKDLLIKGFLNTNIMA